MPAYRRKRSLGCEQLERRFAPSSVLFGAGKRASQHDAQAFDATQVEQAAFYLAASSVLSQSTSVANVAPVILDEAAAGEAERSQDIESGDPSPGFQRYRILPGGWQCTAPWAGDLDTLPVLRVIDKQSADDSGSTPDIPSVEPVSPETPSGESNDADAVGAVPSEELPAGGDDVAAEEFPPVVDDTLVAGDEVADPVGEDIGLPDPSDTEEMPRCGNNFEDLGPIYPVGADTECADANGSDEIAVDEVPVEYQSDDAVDEVAPVDA
jgi:hypothetical protein